MVDLDKNRAAHTQEHSQLVEPPTSLAETQIINPHVEDEKAKRPKTAGEHGFNGFTYGLIGWGANVLISIAMGYLLEFKFNKQFDKATDKMSDFLTQKAPVFSEKSKAESFSRIGLRIFILMWGGNMLVPVVKKLEDSKPELVAKFQDTFDKLRGHVATEQEKERNAKVVEELEKEPKQTWKSVMTGRAVGLGAVYGIFFAATPIHNWIEANWIKGTAAIFRHKPATFKDGIIDPNAPKTHGQKVSLLLGTDLIYGALCALVLFGVTRVHSLLSGKDQKKKQEAAHATLSGEDSVISVAATPELAKNQNAEKRETRFAEKFESKKHDAYTDLADSLKAQSAEPAYAGVR